MEWVVDDQLDGGCGRVVEYLWMDSEVILEEWMKSGITVNELMRSRIIVEEQKGRLWI